MTGIDCIKEYRKNISNYLPLIDHETQIYENCNEFGDVNIGWNCGFIDSRPYFYELWSTDGLTMLTIFLSTSGIEDYEICDLEKMLIDDAEIYGKKEGYVSPSVLKIVDSKNNEFFSINIVVGTEDEPATISGGVVYPFALLNDLNRHLPEGADSEDV